jgi:uncharacterized membrane protein
MFVKTIAIKLRNSMWFIPMMLVAGAILLAYACLGIDDAATADFARYYPQPYAGGADSIRMMLSAIATSMITVSGITFSLTISSLAQVSGQLTARVLRNFMSNLTNKLVLGFFVGLFAYCIVVIRTIRLKDDAAGAFIPALSVFMAMALAVIGIGVLIYFIHYVALSVQASTVVSSVADETLKTLKKLYPNLLSKNDQENSVTSPPVQAGRSEQVVLPHKHGYVQLIDEQRLRQFALDHGCVVRVDAGTGDFVTSQSPLVSLINLDQPVSQSISQAINRAFSIHSTRTIDEELAFGIRQLVDIALKALAPAADDTTTAVLALDYLSAILVDVAQRQLQPELVTLSFIPKHPTFANLVNGALDQIRDRAAGNTVVLTRLLFLLQTVARPTTHSSRRSVLISHARLIAEQADATLHSDYQRSLVRQQLVETLLTLDEPEKGFSHLLQPVSAPA